MVLSFCHLFWCVFSYICVHTFDVCSYVSFLRHFQDRLLRKKDVLERSFANLNSSFNGRFTFSIYLKMITWISKLLFYFSPPHVIHRNSTFISGILFSIASALFSGFSFQSNPHNVDPFLILGNSRFHNRFYIWIVSYFSQEHRKIA